ncbi:MAG: DNA-3-methyladenine glycosylase I [Prolixibacteraceae bacterium]|nr:DNA-3-methyladenine glycosylase I [Prolixibacteraceae bacterium]
MTQTRCGWAQKNELMAKYHDEEWGNPLHDEQKLFEFLILEGMQAGLSWLTILNKRENFRVAYDNFDVQKVAGYDQQKVEELMSDSGIIRNRQKIDASINNAKRFLEVAEEFGSFNQYIWNFVDHQPIVNHWEKLSELPAKTELSDFISADLKRRGFKFVGSTVIYAHLQATGMVNDHLTSCFCHPEFKISESI